MNLVMFMRTIYGKKLYVQTSLMFLLAFGSAGALFIVTVYLGMIIDAVSIGYGETVYYFLIILFSLLIYISSSALLAFCGGRIKACFSFCLQAMIGEKYVRHSIRKLSRLMTESCSQSPEKI